MQFIQQIFEESPNPTYIKDAQGKIVWANSAYAVLHRATLSQVLEKGAVDFDFSFERDMEVFRADEVNELEEFYKLEDGRGTWYLTVKKPIRQQDGERFLFSTSAEITNLKETIQVAEDSFASKEKFLTEVSGGLEAPINAISSLVRLLKQTYISKDQKRYLNSILSISDYILDVPKDVLEYARVEAGILDLATEVVDITSFIRGIVESLISKAAEQDVTIQFTEPAFQLPRVEINPVYLNQVLVKVIRCAIRYTKSKEVVFSFSQKEKVGNMLFLQFSIRNLGLDQDYEVLAKVFESDNSLHTNEKYKRSRIDLGVYTSKKLIELQGGKVWLEENKEEGTSIEFILSFPVMQQHATTPDGDAGQKQLSPSPGQATDLRLLLVDKNESIQTLVKHQIQNWNTQLDIATNAEDALHLATRENYSLILMDVELTGTNGFEAASAIRASKGPNQFTPIVAFTSNAEHTPVEKFMSAGFTDFLRKPYHAFDLYLCITKNTGHFSREPLTHENVVNEQEQRLFDFSGLGNMAEDSVFIRKMQQLFIDLVPGQLAKLSAAMQQQEWETVALLAHSLKSTYGNIKIVRAAEAMKRIEEIAGTKSNLSEMNKLLLVVKETTQKVINVFSDELGNTP
ncbi:response regulator [Rufibacter sediminis]|uniref:Response regulator n=1 Tax=Rufibacter sediminis TaxID=2762756 RepID=A0ABR6VN20_9BACT|nr:response regulator [Rufibacter sediminis]MBC3538555.1 response regulator [Rufibacter sediminis]